MEKVLAEIVPYNAKVSREKLDDPVLERARGREVLLVDDSNVALSQLRDTLGQLGVKMHIASDGLKALNMLKAWADSRPGDDRQAADDLHRRRNARDGRLPPDHRDPQ